MREEIFLSERESPGRRRRSRRRRDRRGVKESTKGCFLREELLECRVSVHASAAADLQRMYPLISVGLSGMSELRFSTGGQGRRA